MKIYVGWDSREDIAYQVCEHSIKRRDPSAEVIPLKQKQMRDQSSGDGYVEPHLWTGIGKARSGCGAALVGNPDQIVEKLYRYMDMGIRSFIFSGYPNIDECNRFAELVLPRLKTFSMPHLQGKTTKDEPLTPLANGIRV